MMGDNIPESPNRNQELYQRSSSLSALGHGDLKIDACRLSSIVTLLLFFHGKGVTNGPATLVLKGRGVINGRATPRGAI